MFYVRKIPQGTKFRRFPKLLLLGLLGVTHPGASVVAQSGSVDLPLKKVAEWTGVTTFTALSPDGRYAIVHGSPSENNLYRIDLNSGNRELITHTIDGREPEWISYNGDRSPAGLKPTGISGSGEQIVFGTDAKNMSSLCVNRQGMLQQIYLRDVGSELTTRVSMYSPYRVICSSRNRDAAISRDGRLVVFETAETQNWNGGWTDPSSIVVRDRFNATTTTVSIDNNGEPVAEPYGASISGDGRFVAFKSHTRLASDWVYVRDLVSGTTERIATDSASYYERDTTNSTGPTPAMISADGKFVVYSTFVSAPDGSGYFIKRLRIYEMATGVATTVDDDDIVVGKLGFVSADARYILYVSGDPNPGRVGGPYFRPQIERYDRLTGEMIRVFEDADGDLPNERYLLTFFHGMSDDGDSVVMTTSATNMPDGPGSYIRSGLNTPVTRGYTDVAANHWAYDEITRFDQANIGGACNQEPRKFCPASALRNDVMALWLVKAVEGGSYQPPTASGTRFSDIDADYWAASWIENADARRITHGCRDYSEFCPGQSVTRARLAYTVVRARYGANYQPPAATGIYNDVPQNHWAAPYIEQLVRDGTLTGGCNGGDSFCPGRVSSRAWTAWLIDRAFD